MTDNIISNQDQIFSSSSDSEEDTEPNHPRKNCCFSCAYRVIANPLFTLIIILAIVANIIVLAFDRVGMS